MPGSHKSHPAQAGLFSEFTRLFRLAIPLMGAQLAQMGMGVTDVVMAGRYGSADLAGVALGGSIMWPLMMLAMGVVQAITPTVSQLNGAKRYREIGTVVRQGLWMAAGAGIVVALALNSVAPIYHLMRVDPVAVAITVPYLQMCSYGIPALICFFCLRFLSDGMGLTRPALIIAICALTLKIPLNYVLIHGKFGLPEMGGVGCGLAQAIVMWLQLSLIIIVVTRKRFDLTGWLDRFAWPDWSIIKPLLVLGLPIGATIFAEMGMFSFSTLLLGQFGATTVAAHNIAMNLGAIAFMPPLALGFATTIRIGFRVGAGEVLEARTTAAIAIATSVLIALMGAALLFLLRAPLAGLYTMEADVHQLATLLLLFVVFYLAFDAAQGTALGTLRGYKDTRTPMWIAIFSFWVIGLPVQVVLAFGLIGEPMGVYGIWVGLSLGVFVGALLLLTRLWQVSGSKKLINRLSRLSEEHAAEEIAVTENILDEGLDEASDKVPDKKTAD